MTKYSFNTQRDTPNFTGKVFIVPKQKHEAPANTQMSEDAGVVGECIYRYDGTKSYHVTRAVGGALYWHPTSIAEGVEVFGKFSRNEDIGKLQRLVGKKVKIKPFAKVTGRTIENSEMEHTIGKVGTVMRIDDSDGRRYNASATIKVTFKDGSDWWYTPDNLKVVKPKLKVGDLVVANPDAPYYITAGEGRLMEVVEVFDKTNEEGDDIRVSLVADGLSPKVDSTKYPVNSKYFKLFTKKV